MMAFAYTLIARLVISRILLTMLVLLHRGKGGGPAVVETVPSLPIFRVENRAVTNAKRRGARLYVGRTEDVLTIRGSIDAGSGPFETWVTVPDPVRYFGAALRALRAAR